MSKFYISYSLGLNLFQSPSLTSCRHRFSFVVVISIKWSITFDQHRSESKWLMRSLNNPDPSWSINFFSLDRLIGQKNVFHKKTFFFWKKHWKKTIFQRKIVKTKLQRPFSFFLLVKINFCVNDQSFCHWLIMIDQFDRWLINQKFLLDRHHYFLREYLAFPDIFCKMIFIKLDS